MQFFGMSSAEDTEMITIPLRCLAKAKGSLFVQLYGKQFQEILLYGFFRQFQRMKYGIGYADGKHGKDLLTDIIQGQFIAQHM
jgi:hypothetical protein